MNALYKCSHSLTCCRRSQRDYMERKGVTGSIFWQDKSSTSPSRNPSFFVIFHFSATQSISRLMFVRSILSTLTYKNHLPSVAGVISLTLLRYSWLVEMKSVSSAYIASATSRYTMKSTGNSESPCGVPTVVLNAADSASSTLTVMFVSDSRSRMIRTLSVSRNLCNTLRSFSWRIVSNAHDRSIPSISITYLYCWHLATSHRCPHITSAVDCPRRNALWDGERKSSTLSEIRYSVIRYNVLCRVVSSSIGLKPFRGPCSLPGFCKCYQYPSPVPTFNGWCFFKTLLNASAYFRSSLGIESYPQAWLLLSLANAITTSAAVIGESSDFGGPITTLTRENYTRMCDWFCPVVNH